MEWMRFFLLSAPAETIIWTWTTTVFTAISLLFINKIQIKFLLSVHFYFDYTLFFIILQFSNFYERSHCMNVFISYWAFFLLSSLFISLHPFLFVLIVFLVCFHLSFSLFVFARSLLSSQRCWAIFQAAWFSLIWSIIIFHFDGGSAHTHTHTRKMKTNPRRHRHVQQRDEMKWNEMVRFIELIERVPLWLLSYQRMNRNQI